LVLDLLQLIHKKQWDLKLLNIKEVSGKLEENLLVVSLDYLRGGPIDPNDIITRFYESNKARFNVQKEMYKNINAAQILGESGANLRREFTDRQLSATNIY
jgi:hypothetical protein